MTEEWEATPELRWHRRVPAKEELERNKSRYDSVLRGYLLEQRWRRYLPLPSEEEYEYEWRALPVKSHIEEPVLFMPVCDYPEPRKPSLSEWAQKQIVKSKGES